MTAVANKLREARSLIERGWTQGEYARDQFGEYAPLSGVEAVCWCSIGALKVAGAPSAPLVMAIGMPFISAWNDDPRRTQADVLAAFDRAISIAESGQ